MKINKLSWKNFASYGETEQTLNFENSQGSLWLLNGLNGSGKSTISDVLSFALYGKVDGKNKSELPNRINKKLIVDIEFISKGKNIKITRGALPNVFKAFVDDVEIDLSGDGVQTYLEKDIYEIPHSIFKNLLVLSINDFKSFLTMSPADKRLIFDKLFGFSIINLMKENNKSEKSKIKDLLSIKENTKLNHLQSIEKIKNTIQTESEKIEKTNFEILNVLESEIVEIQKSMLEITNIGKQKSNIDKEIKSKIAKLSNDIVVLQNTNNTLQKSLDLHSNNKVCPMCLSGLHNSSDISLNIKKEIDNNFEKIKPISEDLKLLKVEEQAATKDIQLYREMYVNANGIINDKQNQIKQIKSVKTLDSLKSLHDLIIDHENKISELSIEIETLKGEQIFLNLYDEMVGDNGIKSTIIKNMIPNLNFEILELCNKIGYKYNLEFDEKLDVKISKINDQVPIKSLSTGEKKMADFICLVAFLKYIKLKYSSINLLFLDEIFSSIDSDKIYEISKILRNLCKDLDLQVFVMHHAPLPSEHFDKFCDVKIIEKFSHLQISE
jgi:DNA repair exonuclease SbcCD ATPase subunit